MRKKIIKNDTIFNHSVNSPLYYYFTISFISFKYKQERLRLEHLQPTLRH